ncbi:hypothetical protein P4S72_06480 [Vibrio sp. PP-XX7]
MFKMQNPFWDIGYKHGIGNAAKMVFFITPEWLGSRFCKQEFDWLRQTNNRNINAAFVIAHDTPHSDPTMHEIKKYASEKNALMLEQKPESVSHLQQVHINGSQPLSFKRSISMMQFSQLSHWLTSDSSASSSRTNN